MRKRKFIRLIKPQRLEIALSKDPALKQAAEALMMIIHKPTVTGVSLGDLKKALPDIEIYIDNILRLLKEPDPKRLADMILDAAIHENCHEEGFTERQAEAATNVIMEMTRGGRSTRDHVARLLDKVHPMVHETVWCPKLKRAITWDECLRCKEKTAECPTLAVRRHARERGYKPNIYHVTELVHPRKSYFNRQIGISQRWDDSAYMTFFMGTATHRFWQSTFPREETEIPVWRDFPEFAVTGSVDVVHDGILYEFKTHGWLEGLKGKPAPEHVLQAKAYYTLLRTTRPFLAKEIKKLRIIYGSKRSESPPRREFDIEPEDITPEIRRRAAILHEALKRNEPPAEMCPRWMCKYCDYAEFCKGKGPRHLKNDKTFKKYLKRGAEGTRIVLEFLRDEGRLVWVNPLAESALIIPRIKNKLDAPDLVDLKTGQKIDVKATMEDGRIWINARQLKKAVKEDWVYYFVSLKSGEIRKIRACTLKSKLRDKEPSPNQWGEPGYTFDKKIVRRVR